MMSRKKKIIIISTIVLICFVIMGFVYALVSDRVVRHNKFKVGSVDIEDKYFVIRKEYSKIVETPGETPVSLQSVLLEPGDVDTISWTTVNKGASATKTRQTLEIYWDEMDESISKQVLYLYPANMKKSEILEDFEKGENAQYQINTQPVTREVDGKTQVGIKYEFLGDTLEGTDGNSVNNEVNYNSNVSGIIDTNINTDDNNAKEDEVAFRILVNPHLSYLYQNKPIYAKITTEGMQYLEGLEYQDGQWIVVDTQQIP